MSEARHNPVLAGQTAVITGGASGIGKSIVQRFLEAGASCLAADLNEEALAALKQELAEYGDKLDVVKVDVSNRDDVEGMVDRAVQTFGQMDIIVNNAGITNKIPFDEMTLEHWNLTYSINITGAFLFAQRAMRIMKAKGYGQIINMSSIAGHVGGLTSGVDYATTKGAMLTLTKSVAKQGAAYGVTCNSIAPGNIKTAMEKVFGSDWDPMAVPMHRLGEPEDISDVVLFLASDMSRYMTGCCLNVNGGLFMQ